MKTIQHTRQHDQSDCGVACLRSVLRYHGSDASVERLRELSGTTLAIVAGTWSTLAAVTGGAISAGNLVAGC